jgi:hypothetical protein
VWITIVMPVVVIWGVLLLAPRSAALPLNERILLGSLFSGSWVPVMWVRIRE